MIDLLINAVGILGTGVGLLAVVRLWILWRKENQ